MTLGFHSALLLVDLLEGGGMLLLTAGGGWLAWRAWERVGRGWPGVAGGAVPRSRFLAVVGLVNNAFFAMVILAQWLPILSPCHRLNRLPGSLVVAASGVTVEVQDFRGNFPAVPLAKRRGSC